MAVRIRLAALQDADAIAGVLREAFKEFEPLYTPAGFRATTPTAVEIGARLKEGPVWVACEGAAVIGTVSAVERGGDLYIRSMAVLPSARGTGIARELMAGIEAHAAARGSERLTLCTTPFLASAIALYEQLGFRREPDAMDLHGTPLVQMIKKIEARGTPRA